MRAERFFALAGVATLGAGLGWASVELPLAARLTEPAELTTLDWRMRSAADGTQAEDVVLVLFDSATVEAWPYLMPFPRSELASLIDAVAKSRPSAIALDVFLDRLQPQLESIGGGDTLLRDAIARAGNVVLVAHVEREEGAYVLRPPHPYFAEAAAATAIVDLPTPYETTREAVLAVRTRTGFVPGLALALFAGHRGSDVDSLLVPAAAGRSLSLPGLRTGLPVDRDVVTLPLPFRGPPSHDAGADAAFRTFGASTLIELGELIPPEWLRDRIVLLGSGFHAEDQFRTPFYGHRRADGTPAGWMFGTEIHATAVEALLSGGIPLPLSPEATVALLLLVAFWVATATFTRGVGTGALAAVVITVCLTAVAWLAFDRYAIHIPLIGPALVAGFTLTTSAGWVSLIEGRDKRRIRTAFARYVAPEIVEELVSDPRRLRLGGEKREITILFTDLVDFTPLSASAPPDRVVSLLNRYLDEMTCVVIDEGGMLDKYIGDSVMALFGAPRSQVGHAVHACRAALRMQRRLERLNEEWRADGWPGLRMRVGINTGQPVVGNIGGTARFDYTALGDSVNLAARLEPACRTYGVGILISDTTAAAAAGHFTTRELDTITVVGRSEPVRVFELVSEAHEHDTERDHAYARFAEGLNAYRRRDFELAERYFAAAVAARPDDAAAALYMERCRTLLVSPPPPDWDFVSRLSAK